MSIYASIAGIDDDHPLGPPWIYRGSHLTPAENDPRGGDIGLAQIPSHITEDGRDDQPEDGPPWPWLRIHIAVDGDDPTVLLDVAQARALAADLTAWADRAEEAETGHRYLSTGCLHGRHDYCQAMTGHAGAKRPAECKFCAARCICACHQDGGDRP